jgi:hypothetical protein
LVPRDVPDARPREMVGKEWQALRGKHIKRSQTRSDCLASIGIVDERELRFLHRKNVMESDVTGKTERLPL